MSVRLKDSKSVFQIRWIPKYTTLERFLHWMHTATFIPLALTGLVLFAPWLQSVAQSEGGSTVRLVHRIAAVFFGGVPILYAVLQPRRLMMHVREFLSFGKYDLLWLKAAVPYYLLGRHGAMPPQPRFNTGERLNAVVMVLGTITFGITGLVMWFGRGSIPQTLYQIMVIFHDLAFIVTVAMFMIHFYLAVIHPLMWQSLVSMRYGVVSESYAREHHAMWYYGEKRAKELWEKHKAEEKEQQPAEQQG
ncbi:MAG: cytochrome b/b6 domain-containing protein [Anaerolineae bacterium]|nr:cytochrome b/b6 domain-containing protein [Anaerolineae bacterium]